MQDSTHSSDTDSAESETRRGGVSGAGVVPVCVSPSGEVYVLLGRERYVRNWSSSLKWSGFEGSNSGKEDVVDNAARELCEETAGVLFEKEKVEASLRNDEFIAKISVKSYRTKKRHVTFLKLIKYDPRIVVRFGETVFALSELERCASKLNLLNGNGRWGKDNEANDGGWSVITNERGNVANTRMAIETILRETNLEHHPAVRVERDDSGVVKKVAVASEFVEKSRVRLWKLSELRRALELGQGYTNFELRPLFCIVARVICDTLPPYVRP